MEDDVAAYYFDKAVAHFGTAIDADMEKAAEHCKNAQQSINVRTMILHRWLHGEGGPGFRDPAAR